VLEEPQIKGGQGLGGKRLPRKPVTSSLSAESHRNRRDAIQAFWGGAHECNNAIMQ